MQEQYDRVLSQFTRFPRDKSVYDSSVYYDYVELSVQEQPARYKDINVQNKNVRAYALPGNKRCIVNKLNAYLSFLLPNATHFTCAQWRNFHPIQRNLV